MGSEAMHRLPPFILRLVAVALGAALLLAAPWARASARAPTEYEVKAAFLFNFAKFVSWPATAFPSPQAPLVIGVLGENPFGAELARLAADVRVQGRFLEVKHAASVASLQGCHVIFISGSERERLPQIVGALTQARARSLTVGESDNFLRDGGMIRFVVEQNRVRFEISAEAAAAAGLGISSKLLSLAVPARPRA